MNKGYKFTEESKKKMSIKAKFRSESPYYKMAFLQRIDKNGKLSNYHNQRKSTRIEKICPKCDTTFKVKASHEWRVYCSRKCKAEVMSEKVGELSINWQGGKTEESKRLRNTRDYQIWRSAVFERDDYTCIFCFKRGGKLEADHIKRFSDYPELRFAIDNGRTLCKECHKTTETYGRPNKN